MPRKRIYKFNVMWDKRAKRKRQWVTLEKGSKKFKTRPEAEREYARRRKKGYGTILHTYSAGRYWTGSYKKKK